VSEQESGPGGRTQRSRLPDLDTVYTINTDGSRNFLHPADVAGRWQKRKSVIFAILLAIYAVVPWITIGGHPAVLIDLPGREAFLFGRTFTNQDFYLMFFLLSGIGFGLFVLTALWGRIWCGFACPQTVYLEGVFRKVERWIEGPREVRIRRNQGPATGDKVVRKGAKHLVFIVLSLLVAHVFIAYFIPARDLWGIVRSDPAKHWTAFLWVVVMTVILYFDFSWFREQTCLVVCPYGRLQSALIDSDTVVIGYDAGRGEPRSKTAENAGDCVDCRRCIAVCPTGIDIRNGLQLECVGCANCVDACDEIMDRLGRPHGLVRYDSRRGFETGSRRKLLRPRVALYAVLGLIGLSVASVAMTRRSDFEVHALRTRGMPYTIEDGTIRNLLQVNVQNKGKERRVFTIRLDAAGRGDLSTVIAEPRLVLDGLADATVPIFLTIRQDAYENAFPLTIAVRDSASGEERQVEARFLGP
jgi:cytochrome c oxidase accessory protein FixG